MMLDQLQDCTWFWADSAFSMTESPVLSYSFKQTIHIAFKDFGQVSLFKYSYLII